MVSVERVSMKFPLVLVLLCLFVSVDAKVRCIEREREALVSFKDSLIDEYGILSTWQSGGCCKWHGVKCENITGHVVALQLNAAYYDGVLRGKVSSSLLELHHLSYLDLSFNDFGGSPIPEFISSMKQLQHLHLQESNFSGIVPPHIGNLTTLLSLDLSYNSLSTHNLDWLSTSLSLLAFLDLSWIELTHTNWLHHILSLPSLHELHLKNCNLTDATLSADLFVNSSHASLSILDLSYNQLSCSSFHWLSNISTTRRLVKLDMSHNALSGPIPNELFERSLTLIHHLDLSSNMLEGEIPKTVCNLIHLRVLILYHNHYRGDFHDLFGNLFLPGSGNRTLESLQILDLADNQLNGSVPELRAFSAMEELYLGGNNFTGSIPLSLGQLSKLHVLDLSRNSLEGPVYESNFIELHRLKVLDLSFNSGLKWQVGPDWRPPFELDVIHLAGCIVGPSFPKWIQTQKNVSVLDLSSAGIRDEAPKWLVRVIDLSNNELGGEVPNCWDKLMPTLFSLNLADNSFWGEIPPSLGTLQDLHALQLRGNKFSGEFPSGLSRCQTLGLIDVEGNQLSGKIPAWIGGMHGLMFVNLGRNNLHGSIPPAICNLTLIRILDLSVNNLSGEVPDCFNNFTELGHKNTLDDSLADYGYWYSITYNQDLPNVVYNKLYVCSSFQWKGRESEYRKILKFLVIACVHAILL